VAGDGRTSVPGVYAAGEITGVGGSALAVLEGELAGYAAAGGALSTRELAQATRRRDRLRAFADLMHTAHPVPAGWPSWLDGATLVCRCEEVPHDAVSHAVTELGATTGRAVKSLARPGMGWCQGRVCGYPTATLTARGCDRRVSGDDLLAFAHRPLATPVRLADLAGLADRADTDRPEADRPDTDRPVMDGSVMDEPVTDGV
jgi:D-hydroxyproline dehydrogenase subunit alpha